MRLFRSLDSLQCWRAWFADASKADERIAVATDVDVVRELALIWNVSDVLTMCAGASCHLVGTTVANEDADAASFLGHGGIVESDSRG